MFFSLIVGSVLAFLPLSAPNAWVLLAAALAVKVIVDVRYEKTPYLGTPSPFLIYCHNLVDRGESISHAIFSYALQLILFGVLLGGGFFSLLRYLRG